MLTLQQPISTPAAIVKRLEDACDQLARSVSEYLDSCLALNAFSKTDFPSTAQLVRQIDHNLDFLSTQINPRLTRSHATLSHTRNKLMSRLCCFPEELLVSILWYFVGDYEGTYVQSHPYVDIDTCVPGQVRGYYHRLMSIGAVCSVWRKLIAYTPSFWSLIPFIVLPARSDSFFPPHEFVQRSIIITQTQGSKLHLAFHLGMGVGFGVPPDMSSYVSRISSLNIACNLADIEKLLQNLLQKDGLGSLSDLSVSCQSESVRGSESKDSPALNQLALKLSNRLRVLRIGALGVNFDPDSNLRFSCLVELRIQAVTLGSTSFTRGILATVAAAPSLRVLRVITVTTVNSPTLMTDDTPDRCPSANAISLPNLDVLYLDDLPLDLTSFLIHSISPGSHRLTICMREKKNYFSAQGDDEKTETSRDIFHDVEIETLYLDKCISDVYEYNSSDITRLLRSMNLLKELQLDSWADWSILDSQPGSQDSELFTFQRLYITRCSFLDASEVKEVIKNCPVEDLIVGGSINVQPIQETDEIVAWLRATVPRVSLIPFYKSAPELQTPYWWL